MPSGCNVCNSRIQKLSFFCLWFSFQLGLWSMIYILDLPKSSNEYPGDTKCWLTCKSVFFARSLLCPFILLLNVCTLSPTYCDPQTWVKEVNNIRCFAIDITKYLILLSCRLAMEHLCVLQLEAALATLVTTWFTLADRRWRSRYHSSDQCILNVAGTLQRVVQGTIWPAFHFFNFFPMMTDNACNFPLRRMVSENKGNPFVDLFFFVLQEVISVNFTGFWKPTLYNFVIISLFLQMMA